MVNQLNNGVSELLYQLSSLLLLPVMLLVVGMFVWVMVALGGFVREWADRQATRKALSLAIERLGSEQVPDRAAVWQLLASAPSGIARTFASDCPRDATERLQRRVLMAIENTLALRLGRLGFVARVGPMLGLLGTLIPFGPALAGLSGGDIKALSANLVTAFATTVVGLLCGALAYAMAAVRRGWYGQDMEELEFVLEELNNAHPEPSTQTKEMGPADAPGRRRPHRRSGQPV